MHTGESKLAANVLFTVCAVILLLPSVLHAAPYSAEIFQGKQPDSTFVSLRLWGDEFYIEAETLDGYSVVWDPKVRGYCYAFLTADGSDLVSTGSLAGTIDPSTLGLDKHLKIRPDARKLKIEKSPLFTKDIRQKSPPSEPTTGTKHGICLLISFPDKPGDVTFSREEVNDFCNLEGYSDYDNNGSVRDYFYDVSGEKLTYTNTVFDYYTTQNNKSYYDNPNEASGPKAKELIREAIEWLDGQGKDFSQFDQDGDGYIDAINTFYAGACDSPWTKGLWPHKFQFFSDEQIEVDGVKPKYYQITNMGSSLSLGTFCHENGHMLCGFPDLYDYGYESIGIGSYGLMCSYGSSKSPLPPCAYLKNKAGWMTVTELDSTSNVNASLTVGTNTCYLYENPADSKEYFIIENKYKTGRNASLPSSGLAIWHVDEDGSNDNEQMTAEQHYECTLIQADNKWDLENNVNYGDENDLFFSGNNDSFNDSTSPDAKWWDDTASRLSVSAISAAGMTMTFKITPNDEIPTITITGPTADDTYQAGGASIDIGGTAADNTSIVSVKYQVNSGSWNDCSFSGTTSVTWSQSGINIDPGQNTVKVRAYDGNDNYGDDTLTVDRNDSWDPDDDLATGGSLLSFTTTEQAHGHHILSATDTVDWYRIDMNAGDIYIVRSECDWTAQATGDGDVKAWLYSDSAGTNQVTLNDDGGGNLQFKITYTAANSQIYYLKVSCYSQGKKWSGYIKYYEEIPADTENPGITITGPTSEPSYQTSTGTIDIAGSATDNTGVTDIKYQLNGGDWISCTYSGTTTVTWSATGLSLNAGANTIKVAAYDAAGNNDEDSIAVTYVSGSLDGDTFSNAIPIASGITVEGTTVGWTDDYNNYTGCTFDESGPDIVYRFTTIAMGTITAALTGTSVDFDLFILSGTSPANDCVKYEASASGNEQVVVSAAPAGTYYVVVDGYGGSQGSFTLEVEYAAGRIAFCSNRDGDQEIYMMYPDGSTLTKLTDNSADDTYPALSHDGNWLVFSSDMENGANTDIYSMREDGSNLERLTTHLEKDEKPSWSPDGERVAFAASRDQYEGHDIFTMESDGSDQVQLTHDEGDNGQPSWSPDGNLIAFVSDRDGNHEIFVMNADGTNPVRLTSNQAEDGSPSWSPGGTFIAFVSDRDGNEEIYSMDAADGSNQLRLTDNSSVDDCPSWSPGGAQIAFNSDRDGDTEVYIMGSDGRSQARVTYDGGWCPSWGQLSSDTRAPEITITGPVSDDSYTTNTITLTINGTASDNYGITSIKCRVNDGSWTDCEFDGTTSVTWSKSGITLDMGENSITVRAFDEAELYSEDTLTVTFVDISEPTVTITSPTSSGTFQTTGGTLDIAGTATDNASIASVRYQVNSGTWQNCGFSGSVSVNWSENGIPLEVGSNVITVRVSDTSDNVGQDTLTVTYSDEEAPLISITSPTSAPSYQSNSATINLGGTASDNVSVTSVKYKVNSANWVNCRFDGATSVTWSESGITLEVGENNTVSVRAYDDAGHYGEDELSVLSIDTQDPSVSIINPTSESSYQTGDNVLDIGGTASDNVAVVNVQYRLNAGDWNVCGFSGTATVTWLAAGLELNLGQNTVDIHVFDAAENSAETTLQITYIDTQDPVVSITSPTSDETYQAGGTVSIGGTASDNIGVTGVTYQVNGGDWIGCSTSGADPVSWTVDGISLNLGENTIIVRAFDAAGNNCDDTLLVTNTGTEPPAITITAPSAGGDTVRTSQAGVDISGSAEDDVGVSGVACQVNDGSWLDCTFSGTTSVTWSRDDVPLDLGENFIKVRAYDDNDLYGESYITVIMSDSWDPVDDAAETGSQLTPTGTGQSHGPHSLSAADTVDWYRIEMTGGYIYTLWSDYSGQTAVQNGNGDIKAWLFSDSAGENLLAADDHSGENQQFKISYKSTGTHVNYLKVSGSSNSTEWEGYIHYQRAAVEASYYGLMVGIDTYDPDYAAGDLPSCVNDVDGITSRLLSDPSRWNEANITIRTDDEATESSIRTSLSSLAQTAVSGDIVVYFHSSHGGRTSGTDAYLCAYDDDFTDTELASDLANFADGVTVIIVIDACYSGGLFKDLASDNERFSWPFARNVMSKLDSIKKSLQAESKVVTKGTESIGWITACDFDETCLAGTQYSLFAGFLIESFIQGDSDDDGTVSFKEMYDFAAPRSLAENSTQHAQISGETVLAGTVAAATLIDEQAPVISITSPTSGGTHQVERGTVNVGGTATDDLGIVSIKYLVNSGEWDECTFNGITSVTWTAEEVGLDPGDNVITVRASDAAGNYHEDFITVTYSPREGDVFSTAFSIVSGETIIGDTSDFSNDYEQYGDCFYTENGPDTVYMFSTAAPGEIKVALSGTSVDFDLFLLDGTSSADDCVKFSDTASGDETVVVPDAPAGTYYAVVDGFNRAAGTFSITVTYPTDRVAFSSDREGNREIYLMRADGSDQVRLTTNSFLDEYPDLSPDGSRLVFVSGRDGNYEIYVMNADGTNPVRLTEHTSTDRYPAWSPDGSKVAFSSNREGGNPEIYVMNADGSSQVPLTGNPAFDYSPAWSPDGSRIVFVSDRDGGHHLYAMDSDGANQSRLTDSSGWNYEPSWSPDGNKITFISSRDGNNEIYVMNADGTGQTRLTSNAAGNYDPTWSRDNSMIIFSSFRDGDYELYMMQADGSNETRVTTISGSDREASWGLYDLDDQEPQITITGPVSTYTYQTSSNVIDLSGTAEDNVVIASIDYQVNGGGWIECSYDGTKSVSWSVSGITLVLGENSLVVRSRDASGTSAEDTLTVFYNDIQSPTITIIAPSGDDSFETTVTSCDISGTGTDNVGIASLEYQINDGDWISCSYSGTTSITWSQQELLLVLGENVINIRAFDESGLCGEDSLVVTLIDRTPPTATITTPTQEQTLEVTDNSIDIAGTAEDNIAVTGISYRNNEGSWTDCDYSGATEVTWSVSGISLVHGQNKIQIRASDASSLFGEDFLTVTYTDTQPPVITITAPTADAAYQTGSGSIEVGGTAGDNSGVDSIVSRINEGAWESCSFTGTTSVTWSTSSLSLPLGETMITVRITDLAGLYTEDSLTITYSDTLSPTIAVSVPTSGESFETNTGNIDIGGLAEDDIGITNIKYRVNEGEWSDCSFDGSKSVTWSEKQVPLELGENVLSVRAYDAAGNDPGEKTLTVLYTDSQEPVVTISGPTSSETCIISSETIDMGGIASDNVGVVSVQYQVNDGPYLECDFSGTTGVTWSKDGITLEAGENQVIIRAIDESGLSGQDSLTVIVDILSPEVVITAPTSNETSVTPESMISISGTASDNIGIIYIAYRVGDGVWTECAVSGTSQVTWSAGEVALQSGENQVIVRAVDEAGLHGEDTISVLLDDQAPTVVITSPTVEPTYQIGTITMDMGGTAADNFSVMTIQYQVNSGAWTEIEFTGTTSVDWSIDGVSLRLGNNTIKVRAYDTVDNFEEDRLQVTCRDDQPPEVAITVPAAGDDTFETTGETIDISGTADDNTGISSVLYKINDLSWKNCDHEGAATATWEKSGILLNKGANTILVRVYDIAGLYAETALTVIRLESEPPTITVTAPTSDDTFETNSAGIDISGTGFDNAGVTGVSVHVNDSGWTEIEFNGSTHVTWAVTGLTLEIGENIITVKASDASGNHGQDVLTVTYIETQCPIVAISDPTSAGYYETIDTLLSMDGYASDNVGIVRVDFQVNDNPWYDCSFSGVTEVTWTAGGITLETGRSTVTVRAEDFSGNHGAAALDVVLKGLVVREAGELNQGRSHQAVVECGGKLYVIGGHDGTREVSDIWEIDPESAVCESIGDLPADRSNLAAAACNGKIYVLGGYSSGFVSDILELDPATGESVKIGDLPTARCDLAAAACAGMVYAIGGSDSNGQVFDIVEMDPETGAVSVIGSLPTARSHLAAAAVDGQIFAAGGMSGGEYLSEVLKIDPATGDATVMGDLYTVRESLAAAVYDDRVYVIGGSAGEDALREIIEIDPATEEILKVGDLPASRSSMGAAACGNTIYVVGGVHETAITPAIYAIVLEPQLPFDVENPVMVITDPPPDETLRTGQQMIDVTGEAHDDVIVAVVQYRINDDSWTPCEFTGVASVDWIISGETLELGENIVTVRAFDGEGNSHEDALTVVYTTLATPPGLTSTAMTSSGFTLGWDTVPEAEGYRVYIDAARFGQDVTSGTTVEITGLLPSTLYSVTVSAFNVYGEGPDSDALMVTTYAPGNIISGTVAPTGATVELFENGVKVTAVAAAGSYVFHGLDPEGEYTVRAYSYINEFLGYMPVSQTVSFTGETTVVDLALEAVTAVIVTDSSGTFWGTAEFHGSPVLPGDVVTAMDGDDTPCGVFIVQQEGEYGLMPVYGDETGTPDDEGAEEGETIAFSVNGENAQDQGPDESLWHDGQTVQVDIAALGMESRVVDLYQGWNCVTVGVVPESCDVRDVFVDITASVIIMREYASDGVRVFDPNIPFRFCTLSSIGEAFGYQVKMSAPACCMVTGMRIAADTSLTLHRGWNVVPYYGTDTCEVPDYFSPVMDHVIIIRGYHSDGVRVYDPSIPERFNTLTALEAPFAYQVKMADDQSEYVLIP